MTMPAAGNEQLTRALQALTEMRRRVEEAEREKTEPIAIVGLGCRFPGGVDGPAAFWTLLHDGIDAVTEVPADRWDAEALYDPDPQASGKMATRWGGFLRDVDAFDAAFFGISPREAARMDPQQRLLLEVAWEALEDAGLSPARLAGTPTGVFVGVHSHSNDYWTMQAENAGSLEGHSGTGTSHSVLAGRVSYLLDFRGPALAVDTACSSSLVAVHLACQSVRSGECSTALAGGVNLILSPEFTMASSRLQMLAADGRCKAFDARADGFVRAEGCAVIVLRRLSDALAAGDPVLAVIRGSAINQDGKTNGLTAPSGLAQQAVIREAMRRAGVAPADVTYVEAHGTGTPLGDPIEVEALAAVLGPPGPDAPPCLLGSVKTNFGHLEGAAGIAGLIKVVLALRHDAVPSHLHLSRLNPHLSLEGTRLRVPTTLTPWPRGARRRHAGVSAFGWSGTNAHVIVEEGPEPTEPTPPESPSPCELLAISAHSREALGEIMRRYEGLLTSPTVPALADICATAARRRSHHAHRVALVASSPGEMGQQLRAVAWGEAAVGVVTGTVRADRRGRVAFVFSGQGSQWLGMGRSMLALEPAFRDALDRCDAAIARHASWSVLAELAADETTSRLNEIDVVQPALFAIAVGLAALWRSWGVEPGAVIGHSMGEIAAAHVAGALSLDDAARVICRRSQLLRQVKGHGAMAVIDVPPAEAARMLAAQSGRLSVAVATSPRSTVVSGDPEALETLLAALRARDVFCRRVNVDVASHSPQMDPLLEPLQGALDGIAPCDSRLPMYSTVTATRWPGRELGAPYWARNLRDPVLFSATVERLVEDGFTAFVELSPHPLLSAALHEILESLGRDALVLPSLRREEDERAAILCSAAALWTAGHPLNWEHLSRGSRRCVTLPRYPWQHEQFWIERIPASVPADRSRPGPRTAHPVLGSRVELADQPQRHVWELTLDTASALARYHHRLGSTSLLAASAHLGVMAAAARSVLGAGPIRLRDVEFRHALVVPESGSVPLQITAAPDREGSVRISLFTRPGSAWVCHSTAMADRSVGGAAVAATALAASSTTMAGSEIYDALRARGIGIAPALQCIERLSSSATGAVATVTAAERVESDPGREIATLDVCFQLPAVCAAPAGVSSMALPTRLDEVRIYGDGGRARRGEASGPGHVTPAGVRIHDLRLVSDDDRVEIELVGLHLVPPPAGLSASPAAQALYEIQWRRETTSVPSAPAGLCVIFGTDDDLTTALVRRLEQQARRCVVVTPGSAWGESATGGFVVNPTDATEIARALEAGVPSGQELATVVSLWGLRSDIDEDDVTACRHALAVLHGLTRVPRASSTRLWIVTCGAQAVGSPRPLALAQAGLWGLGRVIGEEHPDLWGGLVDLDPEASAEDRAACVADAIAGRREHDQLAYREGHRHVARLVRSQASVAAALALPGNATYLLTGGLGALGLEVARRLVQRGARHLALVSRTPLPSRDRWDDPRNDAGVTRRIAAIRELEVLGAQVHLAAADIGDEKRLQDLIRQLGDAAPPVRGVVHAAAAIDDRLLGHVDAASLERVWRGKVRGAWALHRVLGATPLDFFVLFASLGGVLGQTGQGSYAAANAFLDALAQHRRAMGQVAVSIDWAAWSDLGFAATEGGRRVIVELERRGIKAFSPSQALDVFELVLAQGTSQMMAAAIDWTRFGAARRGGDRLPSLLVDLLGPTTAAAPSHDVEALRALPLVERRRRLQEYVQTDVAAILKLPASRVEAQVPLGTLGLDSLTTLELRRRLERRVGQPLPATLVWNYPTAADLAGYLAGLLSDDTVSTESARARSAPAAAVKHVSDLTEDEALRALLATRRGA